MNCSTTSAGEGTRAGLTSPLARTASHSARRHSQGAAMSAGREMKDGRRMVGIEG